MNKTFYLLLVMFYYCPVDLFSQVATTDNTYKNIVSIAPIRIYQSPYYLNSDSKFNYQYTYYIKLSHLITSKKALSISLSGPLFRKEKSFYNQSVDYKNIFSVRIGYTSYKSITKRIKSYFSFETGYYYEEVYTVPESKLCYSNYINSFTYEINFGIEYLITSRMSISMEGGIIIRSLFLKFNSYSSFIASYNDYANELKPQISIFNFNYSF